ncbi:hypothetical protein Y032_0076g1014 [Ancylostoma ceylanicum]|uniref:Uncharacterized protein n=1 Tax=Ancylostoma ceylanicum TaxID=53326 RepID=A0A016TUN3_9BILA|nr:hypothetical protein Y032_0076g1014 [Ancylostoma ceylanicum]
MLDFESIRPDLVGTTEFELEFLFIAPVSATADLNHYVLSIDISITWRKPVNGKFSSTTSRPSERSRRDKSNGDQIASIGAVLASYSKATVSDGDSAERPSVFDIP